MQTYIHIIYIYYTNIYTNYIHSNIFEPIYISEEYLFACSRTERVRKLIHIPSLFPKIHSRIPAHGWVYTEADTRSQNRELLLCIHRESLTDVSSVQAEALIHRQSEQVLGRERKQFSLYSQLLLLLNVLLCSVQVTTRTYRLDTGQHAHVSSKVCGLEDGLVLSLEVQVDHQRLQPVTDDP